MVWVYSLTTRPSTGASDGASGSRAPRRRLLSSTPSSQRLAPRGVSAEVEQRVGDILVESRAKNYFVIEFTKAKGITTARPPVGDRVPIPATCARPASSGKFDSPSTTRLSSTRASSYVLLNPS